MFLRCATANWLTGFTTIGNVWPCACSYTVLVAGSLFPVPSHSCPYASSLSHFLSLSLLLFVRELQCWATTYVLFTQNDFSSLQWRSSGLFFQQQNLETEINLQKLWLPGHLSDSLIRPVSLFGEYLKHLKGFPGGSVVNVGDAGNAGSISGSERSPGEAHGNPLQYSCLGNPTNRGVYQATVHRVT